MIVVVSITMAVQVASAWAAARTRELPVRVPAWAGRAALGPAGRASLQSLPVALNDRMLVVDEIEDRSVPGHALSADHTSGVAVVAGRREPGVPGP